MEKISYEIGEEVVYKQKELIRILDRILKIFDDEEKSKTPCVSGSGADGTTKEGIN